MGKKTIIPASAEAKNAFDAGIESIKMSNSSVPNISKEDKKGAKLLKAIEPLVDYAIEHAPKFEDNLPRKFELQLLSDDKTFIAETTLKIVALEIETQRLKDANTVAGIRMRKNYRIVYDAGMKTLDDDNSVAIVCETLGTPYKRPPLSDQQKADKAIKALEKAQIKADKAANKIAKKTAKKA